MKDRFATRNEGTTSPASDGFSITPNDGADLSEVTRAVYVGTSGDIAVIMASGTELIFRDVAGGYPLPIRVRLVKATGTTAENIVGLV